MDEIYLITFYNKGEKLCTRLEKAENEDTALMNAEFGLICNGIEYDDFKVELIPEGVL